MFCFFFGMSNVDILKQFGLYVRETEGGESGEMAMTEVAEMIRSEEKRGMMGLEEGGR